MTYGSTATETLRDEHQKILRLVDVLQVLLAPGPEGDLDLDDIEQCVTFIRLFADACHHGQEEDLLFEELASRGIPRTAGPVAVMLHEHEQGRALVRSMSGALDGARGRDAEARKILVNAGRAYMNLIRAHINKEDNVLFPMADQLVTGGGCRKLCEAYGVVCQRKFEGQSKEELESILTGLEEKYSA